jgi:hypothetical protein
MVGIKVAAGFRIKAFTPGQAPSPPCFLQAGFLKLAGPSHIVDIAFEILVLGELYGFLQDGFLAAALNHTALMIADSTEGAPTIAAPVAGNAELHLLQGRHTALLIIGGMPAAHIRKPINLVQLLLGHGLLGTVLYT